MKKDATKLTLKGNGFKHRMRTVYTVSYVRDKDTPPLYEAELDSLVEEAIFVRLCNRIKAISNNSIEYINLQELGELLGGYKNLTKLGHMINKFEEKGLIAKIKYRNRNYIYINPKYAFKSRDIMENVLDYFDYDYTKTSEPTKKNNNSKVTRNKIDRKEMAQTYPAIERIMTTQNCDYNTAWDIHNKELEVLAKILETDVDSLIFEECGKHRDLPNEEAYRHLFVE